ncbi:MAG: hypothetical protein HQK79_21425 [Desulfobacterales bacterium]|nr:hypothetical protein [Desulfobacterales bacterium]MBF0398315.1 hypothetical protein [Desulfobacterales bacterium]
MKKSCLMSKSSYLRIAGVIIGSVLFIPVSFMGSLYIGTVLISKWDARNIANGDKPHSLFFIAVSVSDNEKPLTFISLAELDKFKKENKTHSFLLSDKHGEVKEGKFTLYRYKILEEDSIKQLIEINYSDDDRNAISRYIAEKDSIRPIYSKLFIPHYMFMAFPYALGFSIILYITGLWLKKRTK